MSLSFTWRFDRASEEVDDHPARVGQHVDLLCAAWPAMALRVPEGQFADQRQERLFG
jgi:hypothetical protein